MVAPWKNTPGCLLASLLYRFHPFVHPSILPSIYPPLPSSIHPSIHSSPSTLIHLVFHYFLNSFFQRPSIFTLSIIFLIFSSILPSNHPSTHSFIFHPSTHSFIFPSIHSFIHSSIHPLIHSFFHPSAHSFIFLSIHSSIHLSIFSYSIYPFIHPSIHLFTHHIFIHPPIHPPIYSFIHLLTNPSIHPSFCFYFLSLQTFMSLHFHRQVLITPPTSIITNLSHLSTLILHSFLLSRVE